MSSESENDFLEAFKGIRGVFEMFTILAHALIQNIERCADQLIKGRSPGNSSKLLGQGFGSSPPVTPSK